MLRLIAAFYIHRNHLCAPGRNESGCGIERRDRDRIGPTEILNLNPINKVRTTCFCMSASASLLQLVTPAGGNHGNPVRVVVFGWSHGRRCALCSFRIERTQSSGVQAVADSPRREERRRNGVLPAVHVQENCLLSPAPASCRLTPTGARP